MSTSSFLWSVIFSTLNLYARMCSHVEDFNARNTCLNAELLNYGYRYHKLSLF